MVILFLFIFYSFYFYTIYNNILKLRPDIFVMVGIPFWLMVVAGVFCGFATKPYGDYWSIKSFLWWSRTEMELLFFFPVCIALVLSYLAVYRWGETNGTNEMLKVIQGSEK